MIHSLAQPGVAWSRGAQETFRAHFVFPVQPAEVHTCVLIHYRDGVGQKFVAGQQWCERKVRSCLFPLTYISLLFFLVHAMEEFV